MNNKYFCHSYDSDALFEKIIACFQLSFKSVPSELVAHAEQYRGKAVILGGYVLEVENLKDSTRILAVQAPLGFRQYVKSKDLSKGRLILIYA